MHRVAFCPCFLRKAVSNPEHVYLEVNLIEFDMYSLVYEFRVVQTTLIRFANSVAFSSFPLGAKSIHGRYKSTLHEDSGFLKMCILKVRMSLFVTVPACVCLCPSNELLWGVPLFNFLQNARRELQKSHHLLCT